MTLTGLCPPGKFADLAVNQGNEPDVTPEPWVRHRFVELLPNLCCILLVASLPGINFIAHLDKNKPNLAPCSLKALSPSNSAASNLKPKNH